MRNMLLSDREKKAFLNAEFHFLFSRRQGMDSSLLSKVDRLLNKPMLFYC
jgi:hypothetical protein